LSRYSPQTIKSLSGIDPKAFPAIHFGGNLYSSNENCLLSWLSYHNTKVSRNGGEPQFEKKSANIVIEYFQRVREKECVCVNEGREGRCGGREGASEYAF